MVNMFYLVTATNTVSFDNPYTTNMCQYLLKMLLFGKVKMIVKKKNKNVETTK